MGLEPEIATCVIGNSGFYDYTDMLKNKPLTLDDSDEELLKEAEEKLRNIKALSPIHFGERIKVPEGSGGNVELVELEWFDNESDWSNYYEQVGAFLLQHLGQ